MNNLYKFLIFLSLLLSGCNSKQVFESKLIQKINSLDMNIYSNEGKKIFTIESPESNYNIQNNTFHLKETTINLYNNNSRKYIINSEESRLSNNNKRVELEGNVELLTLDEDDETIYADRFIWNIEDSIYLLKGNVKFENNTIILSSNKAILNKNNIIEFFNPVKYIIKNDNNENSYEINSENAFYNIKTNSVNFESKNEQIRSKIYF